MRSPLKIFLFLLILLSASAEAQQLSNYRALKIIAKTDTIKIDSLSIIPGSLILRDSAGNRLDTSFYKVIYPEAKIIVNPKHNKLFKTCFATYKVFPYNFSQSFKHKDVKNIEPDAKGNYNPFTMTYGNKSNDIFKFGDLTKNGSISRGVSFGNSQDVVVNSSLNLELSGKLSSDVTILAAITDNNIPIQPEGNTQQIQDFDKVFIQLSSKRTRLIAGDYELSRPKSYFMNFYKKAQGGDFSTIFILPYGKDKKKNDSVEVRAAAAISKGMYAQKTFSGSDGNQGPYTLTGSQGETYIVVLSGTEKVFIDGQQMTRGQDNDYIIDYNTAQVTFTAKRLITSESRISIEFEYTNQNYARSLYYAGADFSSKKVTTRFNYYSEQDIKNQPLQQTLNDTMKLLLSHIGDSLDQAVVPNVDSIPFNNNEVLYKKVRDTVASVVYYPVFVYSTNADSAHFRLGFTLVGTNKGDYVQVQSSANGRVFKWVAPVAGVKQGNYEPVVQLAAPTKKQMFTLSTDYRISKRTSANVEVALSDYNQNLFSTIDKRDDVGYGVKASIKNVSPLSKKDTAGLSLTTEVQNEYKEKDFSPIERYRPVEFDRDWNITQTMENANEDITSVKLSLSDNKKNFTSYQFRSFLAGTQYTGLQNLLNGSLEDKGFLLVFNGSVLNAKDNVNKSMFIRSNADLSKKLKWIVIGVNEDQEHNEFYKNINDSLQKNSYSFDEFGGYIRNPDTSKTKYTVFYKKRIDYLPLTNSLDRATTAQNVGATLEMLKNTNSRLSINGTYRMLHINDTSLTQQKEDKSLLGRLEYYLKAFKGVITSNTYYEIGSGLQVKQEYSYVEVAQGQGVYSWTDYNGDGIKQLNEFQVAAFQDEADYIRVYTPTNQYEKTYTNQFSEVININPAVKWSSKKGFRKFISRFSDQATYRTDHKNTLDNQLKAYDPFLNEVKDTSLISVNSSFRNSFYFNRSNAKFGFDLDYQADQNKTLLVDGFDSRTSSVDEANVKWNISRKLSVTTKFDYGNKTSASDFFNTNDYDVLYSETTPVFSFQPNASFRVNLNYKYSDKRNTRGTIGEKAFLNNFGTDIKYNVLSKGSLLFKVTYITIKYNSITNTPVAYEMLEGLKPGNNATWSVSYQRNLSTNLQLTLNYEGRKSEGVKTVNVGSVQLRASF